MFIFQRPSTESHSQLLESRVMQRALLGDLDVTFWTEQRGQRARDELRQVADQRDRRVVIFGPGQ